MATITGIDKIAMSATAIISTIHRDRMGDEVIPEGCDLSAYRRSPVVFFGHQSIPFPVGSSESPDGRLSVVITPGKEIRATCYFHQHTKEAEQVFDLVASGIIRGVSIGFNPLAEPVPLPRDDRRSTLVGTPMALQPRMFGGFRYERWELLEWSFVGVPANSQCGVVREVLSRDRLAGAKISPLVRKALEPISSPGRAWVSSAWDGDTEKSVGKVKHYTTKPAASKGPTHPVLVKFDAGSGDVKQALLRQRGCACGPGNSLWCDVGSIKECLTKQGISVGCLCEAFPEATHLELKLTGGKVMRTDYFGDTPIVQGATCGKKCRTKGKSGTGVRNQANRPILDDEDDEDDKLNLGTDDGRDDDTDEDDEDEEFDFDLDEDEDEANPNAPPSIEAIDSEIQGSTPSMATARLIGELANSVGRLMDQLKQPTATKMWGGWIGAHQREKGLYLALCRRLESNPHARVALAFARRLVGF